MQIGDNLLKKLDLPGYIISHGQIGSDGRVAFHATRSADDKPVVIETLYSQYPEPRQVAEIRREAEIANRLEDIEGVLKVYGLERYGNGNLALITEAFQSNLIDMFAKEEAGKEGTALRLQKVLVVAISLVKVLKAVHDRGIVHKALTPEHILFDDSTASIRLSRFGIASELSQEHQASSSERLEGPLPYISPEQTGRMKRELDYRSDYYSLGIILFELVTGQRPFEADNVLGWVHQHISRLPPNPRDINPEIPEPLSAVILKLLEKSPEERYQSAQGLIADLEYCADKLCDSVSTYEPFEPGQHDVSQVFLLPQNLYGRDTERTELMSRFEAILDGEIELCMVHGYSGIGKSALVKDIGQRLVGEHGFLIQGKFDQFNQGNAYSGIANALRGLIQQTLIAPKDQLQSWQEKLQEVLSPNAQLIIDLVPELELILGKQPDVIHLPPVEARNRFQLVLISFLSVFSRPEHPLVMFLDDLQWSDTATLEFLKRLVTSREIRHFMLIGAYRSNEVGPGHPLSLTLNEIAQFKEIADLPIKPLNYGAVNALVADALCSSESHVKTLSDRLFNKAQGNPFFTLELIKKLHEEGAIYKDLTAKEWQWKLDSVMWSDLSDDIVEFMADNLRKLPGSTQKVLQLAACIGGSFDLNTLAVIYKRSASATARELFPALKHHLIIPLDSDYKLLSSAITDETGLSSTASFNPSYQFLHDRVQQAAYSLIDSAETKNVHKTIGQLMLRHTPEAQLKERLVDIAGHLNIARSIITDQQERLNLIRLNLEAGKHARRTAAYETAMSLLTIGESLLPNNAWSEHYSLALDLTIELQQCAYLTARLDESERLMDLMLEQSESDFIRAKFLAIRTRQYATLGKMEDSITSAIWGLQLLGFDASAEPTLEDIATERRAVDECLEGRSVASLADLHDLKDESVLIAIRLLMEIFPAAFLSGNGNILPYIVLKAVNLSMRHGNSPESAFAYAAFGMLLCGELDEQALGYQFGKLGVEINERHDDIELKTRVTYVYAMFVHHWSEHWSTLTPWFRKGIKYGYQSGDLLYLAYSAQDCVIWDPTLDIPSMLTQHADNLQIVRETGYQDSIDSATLYLQLLNNFMGQTDNSESLSNQSFNEQECLEGMRQRKFITGIANYHIYKAEACFLNGSYDKALLHVIEQDKLIKSSMSLPQLARFYIVAFLTRATTYSEIESPEEQDRTLSRLKKDLQRMRHWANNCPDNFLHLQYLMEAELACLVKPKEAHLNQYEAAINAAVANGFIRDEAVACERAARHLLDVGMSRGAEGYLRSAHHAYKRWGALRKTEALEKEFPVLQELSRGRLDQNEQLGYGGIDSKNLDLASVMKASRAISREMIFSRLIQTILDILLENAGAQWGCFVVNDGEQFSVEAQSGSLPVFVDKAATLKVLQLKNADQPKSQTESPERGLVTNLPITVISHVLRTSSSLILNDASNDSPFMDDPYMVHQKPGSIFCVPLQRGNIQGVVYMENNLSTDVFTESRLEVVSLLTDQATVAIENAGLYEQVQEYTHSLEEKVAERTAQLEELNEELKKLVDSDGLTGLANRRCFDTYLARTWLRLRREQNPLSIVMFDVDYFKTFNDTYGHQSGDDCLVMLAKTVREQIQRPADLVARYGGEEFIVVLPDTDEEGAMAVAGQICVAVASLKIPHCNSVVADHVTISVGVATTCPDTQGPDSLIELADQALYEAKKQGRNQVKLAAKPVKKT
ncbi:diguanylate cyclase domain-containing protein [Neptuniibacter caesariensis]|uniref:Serine/threonine kinase with two-component sensor domain n=1 Tax=Neptuniibacter caesariensis TaxID=207954 RepID=A0A7U8C7T3_NEPCE|nr:diguanylate cyclase [Neptuniibacter caesariensis]EAR61794.1 serine/threonine kinase with two-component sensor domain [Neptuniibacter caesariensis]